MLLLLDALPLLPPPVGSSTCLLLHTTVPLLYAVIRSHPFFYLEWLASKKYVFFGMYSWHIFIHIRAGIPVLSRILRLRTNETKPSRAFNMDLCTLVN